jgi:hypothetical protein
MAVPHRLFDAYPPTEDRHLIDDLFVDREFELQQAREMLTSVVEHQSAESHRPMVISGYARMGKSHLLWKLVNDPRVVDQFDLIVPVKLVPGTQDIRNAMATICVNVVTELDRFALTNGLGSNGRVPTASVMELLGRLSPVVQGDAQSLVISAGEVRTITESLSTGISISPKLLGFSVGSEAGTSTQHSTEDAVTFGPLPMETLASLVRVAHENVNDVQPVRLLIVLDDFDLIHRDGLGNFDPEPLLKSIATLCESPNLHVLSTIRADTHAAFERILCRLTEIREFDDDRWLLEIYRRHVNAFNDGEQVLSNAVREVARMASGRPGVFLSQLKALHFAKRRPNDSDLEHLSAYMTREWERFRGLESDAARQIEEAVRRHGGELPASQLPALRSSEAFRFLVEDFTYRPAATVVPTWRAFLAERLAGRADD